VIGAVVGAAIVGATWLVVDSQSGSFDSSGEEISAPAKIGGYVRFADAKINKGAKAKQTVARITSWNAKSAERLSASYDGAAAFVETYSDDSYQNAFVLNALRATTPFPAYVPYQDAKTLQIVRPQNEERRFGAVSCLVFNQPTPAGQKPAAESTIAVSCSRTERGLTVQVSNVTGDLGNQPEKVAALVNDAWQELS
jgi:hypothetical protein